MQHADARAFQPVAAHRRGVVRVDLSAAGGGGRIVRILAGNHLQDGDGVRHRPRHRARDVRAEVQRHHAGAAHEAHRRAQADERLMGGRSANGIAGVAGERDGAEIGRGGGGRSAARAGGDAAGVVRVARVAGEDRVDRLDRAERELRHVGLRDHHRARVAQPLHDERVLPGHHALQRQRARRRRHVDGLVVVLDDDRHAVHRADRPRLPEPPIEIVGGLERVAGSPSRWRSARRPACRARRCARGTARRATGTSASGRETPPGSARWWFLRGERPRRLRREDADEKSTEGESGDRAHRP